MTKINYGLIAILTAATLACTALAYLWIDRSISLSYAMQDIETANSSVRNLGELLTNEWRGMPESEVLQKLQKVVARVPDAGIVVKKEKDVIWFDGVRFNFKDERLVTVGNSQ
jgi:hypothetical protein